MKAKTAKERKKHIRNNDVVLQTLLLGAVIIVFLVVLCGGLYVIFRPYSISFDLGDGSEVLTENYRFGSEKITLGIPERDGYRFTGWTGSNGSKPKINVTIGGGTIGNLSYVANWSDELKVTCEDWLIDADGNMIENITDVVDKFLKDGKSKKDYKVQDRTITVKAGEKINPSKWGKDKSYKAYSDKFMYVRNSGDVKVKQDGIVVYRYFYPVLDVNYMLDGEAPSKKEIKDKDVALFNLYINDKLVKERVSDYCSAVPYGASYRIEPCWIEADYISTDDGDIIGTMGNNRSNVDISFATRQGDVEVTCQDWVVDKYGKRLLEITDQVDRYLENGNSLNRLQDRTIRVSAGDVISASMWGDDPSTKAYHNQYCYAGASPDIVAGSSGAVVYRYFYPLLDVGAMINGYKKSNTSGFCRFNLYIDGELYAENVTDFYKAVPSGSNYRIEVTEYLDYSVVHKSTYYDSGQVGNYKKSVHIRLESRSGDDYVVLEDWVVDKNGNRVRNISEEIDTFLTAGNSAIGYKLQDRNIKVSNGERIDAGLFGNSEKRKTFSGKYVYVGSSGVMSAIVDGNIMYRYFYPVLDVNGIINDELKGNVNKVAVFNLYVDGKLEKMHVSDFCSAIPCGSKYEIGNIVTRDGYKYEPEDNVTGVMGDEPTSVELKFESE